MAGYDYLVVGGGAAADEAVRAIREIDHEGSVGMLSAEAFPPYDRPPLSKGLWSGSARLDGMFHQSGYEALGIHLHLTAEVREIRPAEHVVVSSDGARWSYRKLLLATGSAPRALPVSAGPAGAVRTYRTLDDYIEVRQAVDAGRRRVAVFGGGFIGAELSAGLSMQDGARVTLAFPQPSLWSNRLPKALSEQVTSYYTAHGIDVAAGEMVSAIERRADGALDVRLAGGRRVTVDLGIAGIGVEPRLALAARAGIATEGGIVVDPFCRTSAPDVFAAGDVASFPSALGGRRRVEHEDHAHRHGRTAGRNMAGHEERYDYLPMFYSDLFDLGFEAVGDMDARLEMFEDWVEPLAQGVVYYLDSERHVAGVLLWNVWDRLEAARELLREGRAWKSPGDLAGRIRP